MQTTILLTGLILICTIGLGFALYPWIKYMGTDDLEEVTEEDYIRKLREKKEKYIQGLRDLETEREVGNLSEEEYRTLHEQYIRKAAVVVDQLKRRTDPASSEPKMDRSLEDEIKQIRKNLS